MKLYNTNSKQIEKFIPHNDKEVTMYTCGPTVYHFAHIGNLRSYIMHDVLEKSLNYLGYNVKRCMNITDVGHLTSDADSGEDKMLKGAKRENKTVLEIAEMYTEAFKSDCAKLNIAWPKIVAKATDNINEYFKMIETLLNKDLAYISNGNIYFDTSKLDNYYCLTNHKEEELAVGVREGVEQDLGKKNQTDFVLWFTKSKFDDQELKWESPWGVGYPGWHIECSGIALKYLGEYLDIHCGGVDNIFPHHTNEIAQTEGCTGHNWCKYWFHVEHLNDQSGKMSKSKGDFLTVSFLEEKGYNPVVYRYMCLESHYRRQMMFSFEALDNATNAYNRLKSRIRNIEPNGQVITHTIYEEYFKNALKDDLNTSQSLTVLYDILKSDLNGNTKLYLIKEIDKVLTLDLLKEEKIDEEIVKYIEEKINARNLAKTEKNFTEADAIRDELLEKGILIKDTREGTTYEIIC